MDSRGVNSSGELRDQLTPTESPTNTIPGQLSPFEPAMDDFIIGDRVVIGSKPGVIAYIGETQFAAGEWAGIVLDEACGKNDGMIQGVRYFQCDPRRGVFSRLNKLTRAPDSPSRRAGSRPPSALSNRRQGVSPKSTTPTNPTRKDSRSSPSPSKHSGTPTSVGSLNRPGSSCSLHSNQDVPPSSLPLGTRVLVNGNKVGTLRYVGTTEFAAGQWAGVELDQPLGKNDGSVNGKRYFECRQSHGLFAPLQKVTRYVEGSPLPTKRGMSNGGSKGHRGSPHDRTLQQSQESLTSSGSTASNKHSQSGDRLAKSQTSKYKNSTHSDHLPTLKKALREKDQHIEQLLRERELERSLGFRSGTPVSPSDGDLARIQVEYTSLVTKTEDKIRQFQCQVEMLEKENTTLKSQLHDSKQQIEDLQFQLEEQAILSEEQDSDAANGDSSRLDSRLTEERKLRQKVESDLENLKLELERVKGDYEESEITALQYLDQIDELAHKVSTSENHTNLSNNNTISGHEMVSLKTENLALQANITSLRMELDQANKCADESRLLLEHNLGTTERLSQAESSSDNSTNQEPSSELSTVQHQLTETPEELNVVKPEKSKPEKDKSKTAGQLAQLTELKLSNPPGSSQLSNLSQQLEHKQRNLEGLQLNCSNLEQRTVQLQQTIRSLQEEHETQLEHLTQTHNTTLSNQRNSYNDQIQQLQQQIGSLQAQLLESTTSESFNKDLVTSQVTQLEGLLYAARNENSQVQAQLDGKIAFLNQRVKLLEKEKEHLEQALANKSKTTEIMKQQVRETQDKLAVWQQEVQCQVESNKIHSENDLESLKKELLASQLLLTQLERRLASSEEQKSRLQQRVDSLTTELTQLQNSMSASKLSNSTYRDTSDVLFNQLKHQVEVMELNVFKAREENVLVREENSMLKNELDSIRIEITRNNKRDEALNSTFTKELESAKQKIQAQNSIIEAYEQQFRLSTSGEEADLIQTLRSALAASEEERQRVSVRATELDAQLNEYRSATDSFNHAGESIASTKCDISPRKVNGYSSEPVRKSAEPRPYCDICDLFDSHSTENCPVQEDQTTDQLSSPTSDPTFGRARFCGICNVSDHWTADCTVD